MLTEVSRRLLCVSKTVRSAPIVVLKSNDFGRCNVTHGLHAALSGVLGSLWVPGVTADVSLDEQHRLLTVLVRFKTSQYSDSYRVSIQSHGLPFSRNVSMVSEFLVRLRNQMFF